MISQLLDYTRVRLGGGVKLDRKRCDAEELLRRALAEIESANQGVRFQVESIGEATGDWDADRLSQVFSNLAANSVHHGSGGRPPEVVIDASSHANVTVRFSNPGSIAHELLPNLFEPFRGSENRRSNADGLGLGLYISKQLALAHGGDITVSTSDSSVTFSVVLPRNAETNDTVGQVR